MVIQAPENPSNCGSQTGKAKSQEPSRRQARTVRPQGGADLRGLAVRRPQGTAEVRPASRRQAEELAPRPDRRPVPRVLQGRGCRRGRSARPDAAAAVLHGRHGSRNCAASRSPTWTWKTARYSSTRARGQGPLRPLRQVVRHRASHPHRRPSAATGGCSRPGGAASSRTRRVQQVVKLYAEQAGVNATPAHLPPPGDHLADQATRGWRMPNSSSSPGTPGGRRWRSTSTSPWTGSSPTSTRRR